MLGLYLLPFLSMKPPLQNACHTDERRSGACLIQHSTCAHIPRTTPPLQHNSEHTPPTALPALLPCAVRVVHAPHNTLQQFISRCIAGCTHQDAGPRGQLRPEALRKKHFVCRGRTVGRACQARKSQIVPVSCAAGLQVQRLACKRACGVCYSAMLLARQT